MPNQKISEGRKNLYYVGMGLGLLGLLTFGSVFLTAALNFGNFDNFQGRAQSSMFRAFGGMGLMILGSVLANIGRMGLAGSGVVLDPQQARKDVEPWSRMTGSVINDVLDEADISLGKTSAPETTPPDFAERLRQLHALREEGILTEEEYQREKAEILDKN